MVFEKGRDLSREELEFALCFGTVREACRVAEVDEILGRQRHQALVQHREATHA